MIDDGDGLPSSNVYGVNMRRSDSNEVWVTSINGGLATVESRGTRKGKSGRGTKNGRRIENGRVTPLTARWDLPSIVWTVAESPDGTAWIGTGEGLYRRAGGQTSQEGLPAALQSEPVHAVYVDRAGRLRVLVGGVLYTRREGTRGDGQWQRRSDGDHHPRRCGRAPLGGDDRGGTDPH
jgi:ligand-binding sensor domain-containing protein